MPKTLKPETSSNAPMLTRFASADAATVTVDQAARTLRFAFSSPRPVERYAWFGDSAEDLPGASNRFEEVLPNKKAAWNLERVTQKCCPFLKNHCRSQKLGAVTAIEFGDDFVYATVKLRTTADATQFAADAADPDLCGGISFGYTVDKYKVVTPAVYEGEGWSRKLTKPAVLEAVSIQLFEISSEEIPADPTVGFNKTTAVNLRSLDIDGDPGWEQPSTKALPSELKEGDFVAYHSFKGTKNGRIHTISTNGSLHSIPKGLSMAASPENPAHLVEVWQPAKGMGEAGTAAADANKSADSGKWEATDRKVVKRAAQLTKIDDLDKPRMAGMTAMPSKTQQREEWTLAASMQELQDNQDLADLWAAYNELLEDIGDDQTIDDDARQNYMDQAYADFCAMLGNLVDASLPEEADALQKAATDLHAQLLRTKTMATELNPPAPERPIENLSAKLQLEELQRSYDALSKQMAEEQSYRQMATKCAGLQRRAELLMKAGKLTPAMFKGIFGTDDDNPVEIYRAHAATDPVEFLLKLIEDHGAKIVDFRSVMGSEPLPLHPNDRGEPTDDEVQANAAGILARRQKAGGFR